MFLYAFHTEHMDDIDIYRLAEIDLACKIAYAACMPTPGVGKLQPSMPDPRLAARCIKSE